MVGPIYQFRHAKLQDLPTLTWALAEALGDLAWLAEEQKKR